MVGETLPGDWMHNGVFCTNFPFSSTEIPLNNTFNGGPSSDGGIHYMAGTIAQPGYWVCSGFKSTHPGGANFVMADGGVHFFAQAIDYELYNDLGTKAGGESVTTITSHGLPVQAP